MAVHGDELAFLLAVAQVAATITLAGVVASRPFLRHHGPIQQPGGAIRGISALGAIVSPGVALVSALAQALDWGDSNVSMNRYVVMVGLGVLFVLLVTALGAPSSPRRPPEYSDEP